MGGDQPYPCPHGQPTDVSRVTMSEACNVLPGPEDFAIAPEFVSLTCHSLVFALGAIAARPWPVYAASADKLQAPPAANAWISSSHTAERPDWMLGYVARGSCHGRMRGYPRLLSNELPWGWCGPKR